MADQTASDSMGTQADDATSAATPPGAADDAPRTFTGEDVERIVRERLARDRRDRPSDDEIANLKERAARLDEIEKESQTELERAQARVAALEAEATERTAAANRRLVEAAVIVAATNLKAIRPEHLHKLIDTHEVTVGDDGQVTGAEDAVKAFLDANPEYVGTRAVGSADQGARSGGKQVSREQLEGMSREEVRKARLEGRLEHLLTGN